MHAVTVPSALIRCAAAAGWKMPDGGHPCGRWKPPSPLTGELPMPESLDEAVVLAAPVVCGAL